MKESTRKLPASTLEVTGPESGQKLVRFLERRVGEVPRGALMRWIRTGQVRVNKKRAKPFDRVRQGDMVRVPPHTPEERDEAPATPPRELEVVDSFGDVLALSKPAGLPIHGGTGHTDSLAARLEAAYSEAVFKPAPAHRLDKNTSGLVLAATSYRELARLSAMFKDGSITKEYLCWVRGRWNGSGRTCLEDHLEKRREQGREIMRSGHGKRALAWAECLQCDGHQSLMAVRLITGRTHQVRVQLSSRGHPLIGDPKYGGPRSPQGMLLHCWRLGLPDREITLPPPWTGSWAVPPEILDELRRPKG